MSSPDASGRVVLHIESLSKTFPAQKALDDVDLELRSGEVHCLLGQNGSGKSTLIKILAGYHAPDPGSAAVLDGRSVVLGSPTIRDHGVAFIHQDLGLVPDLDVVDNLALGNRYAGRWWVSERTERTAATRLLDRFDLDLDPAAPLSAATPGEQTMVAIVRAVAGADTAPAVLVLDEPTASLPQHQVEQLFGLVRRLRDQGTAVLYVTHRLREVFDIGDRVTVLRDGRRIATRPVADVTSDGLVELIIGRRPTAFAPSVPTASVDVLLRADEVVGEQVDDFSIDVRAGEIVGITGLIGSGYDQVLGIVYGARPRTSGEVEVAGRRLDPGRPDRAIASGVAYAPADRKRLSTIQSWTIGENLTLPRLPSAGPARWLGQRRERREVEPWLKRLDVVPDDPDRLLSLLSGGNQQKVVLARWLRVDAQVLLLDEPTGGVDAGAKASIYRALAEIASQGRAVVLSSSDAEELCAVCDRVLIMRNGAVTSVLDKDELSVARIVSETIRDSVAESLEGPTSDDD
ncbi:sugar ABC transporter ATP-binding protein [Nocardioides sp. LHD-245]|uniref:sugar ABC transporter ATP-binding protein n=1 Tax=Nocardioides sp. LHD-245 TaxID=3051387 RepID=UPI0027DFF3C3|nr:sugar ABC transporter ATP-binding protein [Nocardioides sp. LHD-245]